MVLNTTITIEEAVEIVATVRVRSVPEKWPFTTPTIWE
jgi:hypothetical protein